MKQEIISHKKWDKNTSPERILIIRFHAIGDVALTIPACNSLRSEFPESRIDYLTDELSFSLVDATETFDNVYAFKDYYYTERPEISLRNKKAKLKEFYLWRNKLKESKYDVVLDLQSNRVSKMLRSATRAKCYAEFDKFSKNPAALRVLKTFHLAGFNKVTNDCHLTLKKETVHRAEMILCENGWNGKSKLVVLNPAGLWITRNWPIENYMNLAKLLLKDDGISFLLIGNERIKDKAYYIKEKLGEKAINLTGKTHLGEAFALFRFVRATVTEDSALLHMSWASGVPTLALLGSTRSDWTSPLPPHGFSFNSSDLPCGDCMQPTCKYGDVHCLTRFTPEMVYEKLREMW